MRKDVITKLTKNFEDIKHFTSKKVEFWFARELQIALEYSEWRNFLKVIEKAKIACENSGNNILNHFVDINKKVLLGSGAVRKVDDIELSRYA